MLGLLFLFAFYFFFVCFHHRLILLLLLGRKDIARLGKLVGWMAHLILLFISARRTRLFALMFITIVFALLIGRLQILRIIQRFHYCSLQVCSRSIRQEGHKISMPPLGVVNGFRIVQNMT